jgi:hypothetical protein
MKWFELKEQIYNVYNEFTVVMKYIIEFIKSFLYSFIVTVLNNRYYQVLLFFFLFFRAGVIGSKSMDPYLPQYTVVVSYLVWPIKLWGYLFSSEPLPCFLAKYYHKYDCVVNYPSKLWKNMYIYHQVICLTPQNKLVIGNRTCYVDLTSVAVSKQLTKPYYTHSNKWFEYKVSTSLDPALRNSEVVNPMDVIEVYLFTITRVKIIGRILFIILTYKWYLVPVYILFVMLDNEELKEEEDKDDEESHSNINSKTK